MYQNLFLEAVVYTRSINKDHGMKYLHSAPFRFMGIVNPHVLLDCIIGFSSLKALILNVVHAYMYDTFDYYSFNHGDKWSGTAGFL